jgi:osmotically-inducible protein OsmY
MDQALLEQEQRERRSGHRATSDVRRIDSALRLRIQHALEQSGYQPLRELGVAVEGDEVVLRGRLPTYYLTQLALTKAMHVEGVGRVRHEIQVNNPIH